MSKMQIPESWATTVMINVLEKITDGTHHSPPNQAVGAFKYVTAKNVQDDGVDTDGITYVSEKVHREIYARCDPKMGDILLVKDGATTGRCCINQLAEPFSMLSSVALLRTRAMILESKFLLQWLRSPAMQKDILDTMAGAAIKRLTLKKIQNLPIVVPPLSEQKRVIVKIESTQEKVKTIESSISKAEELIDKYRESLLQKAFRGELVPQDPNDEPASKLIERIRNERARQSDGKKRKKDELPPIKPEEIPFEIPKSWEWVSFGSVISIDAPLVSPRDHMDSPHIAPNHIESNTGRLLEYTTVREDKVTSNKYLFLKNTVLYSKIRPHLNKATFVGFDGVCSADMYPLKSDLHPKFLLNYILSSTFLKFATQSNERVLLPKINREELAVIPIPIPPIYEQERIATVIEEKGKVIDKLVELTIDLKRQKTKLEQSILDSAFCGALVPQNDNEGTGHDLLRGMIELNSESVQVSSKQLRPRKRKKK